MKLLLSVQAILTGVILVLCFQGKGSHAVFWAVVLLFPSLGILLSKKVREAVRLLFQKKFSDLNGFSQQRGTIPWGGLVLFGVLPSLFLVLLNGGTQSSQDNLPTLMSASSLLLEGNAEISEYVFSSQDRKYACSAKVPLPYFARCTAKGVYSAYPAGMLVFSFPMAALSWLLGGRIDQPAGTRLEKWTASWVAALSAGMFLFIALHLSSGRAAILATLFLSAASVLLSTVGQGLWTQGGVIFWLMLFLAVEFHWEGKPSFTGSMFQGLCLSLMFATRLNSACIIAPLMIWVLARSVQRALIVGLVAASCYVPWALFYFSTYGTLFGPQISFSSPDFWSHRYLETFAALLFSPGRGIFVFQPWLLLGIFAYFFSRSVATKAAWTAPKGWQVAFLFSCALSLFLISGWKTWEGGYCYGSRLLAEIVPLAGLLVVRALDVALRERKRVVWATVVVGFAIHMNGVYFLGGFWQNNPQRQYVDFLERAWDWSDPPFLYPLPRKIRAVFVPGLKGSPKIDADISR
ncbi:MAG: hypothetical protein HY537_03045 [Deltaproteobacteria bacterium]|nr:hypothetical protein [Deltaproteobacteria bacterium]